VVLMARLKPSDQYIAKLLQLSEDEYQHFLNEAQRIAATGPQPAVVAGIETYLLVANIVLSVGSLALGSLFAPKAPGKPPTVNTRQQQEPNKTQNQRYAPTSGFDSFQEVAKLQSTIPVIYALREVITNGQGVDEQFGGLRVNLQLLWSQMLSFRNHQMFRGIFLLGEGSINAVDARRFALGDTALTSYDMQDTASTSAGARYSIYFRRDGGRIQPGDLIAGRSADLDGGNAVNAGASDVYNLKSNGDVFRPDACMASTPSATIVFGVYSPIGNNLAYRVNPVMRPTRTLNIVGGENPKFDSEDDNESLAATWKARLHWSPRSAITAVTDERDSLKSGPRVDVVVNDKIYYELSRTSDAKTEIIFRGPGDPDNTDNEVDVVLGCGDVASAVAARQNSADDSLVIGSLYRIGSCWAMLEERIPGNETFVSEAANDPVGDGTSIRYRFRVVRRGTIDWVVNSARLFGTKDITPARARDGGDNGINDWSRSEVDIWEETDDDGELTYKTFDVATGFAQVFRLAVATFTVPRPCQVFEIGIRSRIGIQVSGLCNFRDAPSLTDIDKKALGGHESGTDADDQVNISLYQSGQVSRKETRFSFFRLSYRPPTSTEFIDISMLLGVSGDTSQDVFNYVRLEMPAPADLWEIRMEPVSGWEIRNDIASGQLAVLDSSQSLFHRIFIGGVFVCYHGFAPTNRADSLFRMNFFDVPTVTPDDGDPYRKDLQMSWSDRLDKDSLENSMIDGWGRLAETFVYDEIQASCSNGPEHTVAYINTITTNPEPPPDYTNLAIVGLNIRSSTELQQLGQLSAYVSAGVNVPRLIDGADSAPSHNWPNALYDAALNDRYGTGDRMTPEQINRDSFVAAANWCRGRGYFFDGIIESPRNLRQWAADMAPMFLLAFGEIGGQWYLTPAITFDPVVISGLFTAGNIQENTFKLNWIDADDRQQVRVSASWREERRDFSVVQPGLFPTEQEVLVEERVDGNAPLPNLQTLSLPMSEFCTSKKHAIDACKLVARFRRYTDHRISFETTYDIEHAAVAPDRYIRVEMGETFVSGWNNGMCAADGQVTSTTPLADGSYPVIAWNGDGATAPTTNTLRISSGIGSLPGQVFAVVEQQQEVRTYRVETVRPLDDGRFAVSAVHAPVGPDGVLLMAANWDDANAWRISP
jgi:hypothetical protein